jgi:hypothetical protein
LGLQILKVKRPWVFLVAMLGLTPLLLGFCVIGEAAVAKHLTRVSHPGPENERRKTWYYLAFRGVLHLTAICTDRISLC